MPRICYVDRAFSAASQRVIDQASDIIQVYARQGFDLTLRQLYYQFVSRDLIPNRDTEYKRLGAIINDARLAGLIDWNAIVDRTRNLRLNSHWTTPADIMESAAASFQLDKWVDQPTRVEVWIEKDALVGVIASICTRLDVPYFSCRGYTSQSEMWMAAQRLARYARDGQTPVLLHFGDHDPSGQDMTRDIRDRLQLFMGGVTVERLALNMDQIRRYNPPPNPAKVTDSRAGAYIATYGRSSWELDALEPTVLAGIVEDAVRALRDEERWNDAVRAEQQHRTQLQQAAERWDTITALLADE